MTVTSPTVSVETKLLLIQASKFVKSNGIENQRIRFGQDLVTVRLSRTSQIVKRVGPLFRMKAFKKNHSFKSEISRFMVGIIGQATW